MGQYVRRRQEDWPFNLCDSQFDVLLPCIQDTRLLLSNVEHYWTLDREELAVYFCGRVKCGDRAVYFRGHVADE